MLEPYAGKLARTVLRGGRSGDAVALPDFKPTTNNMEPVEVLTHPEQSRRRSEEEKLAILRETFEPGATVSGVARRHQVNANQVFAWRKLYQDGSLSAVSAGEQVVPASDLAEAMKQIRESAATAG